MRTITIFAWALLLAAGCSGADKGDKPDAPEGGKGEVCYPNGTCDAGLDCSGNVCVAKTAVGGSDAGGTGSGGSDSSPGGSQATAGNGGSSMAGTSGGGTGGSGGEPLCRTVDVTNGTAPEKVNAAFCISIGFDRPASCTYDLAEDATTCLGDGYGYVVAYMQTENGTVGDIYNPDTGVHIGTVIQASTGEFVIEFDNGAGASCAINGDVARFCYSE